jgi:tetratricopeptide (TPR) repeat protein
MWFLWQFMSFRLVLLFVAPVQPTDFKKSTTDSHLSEKQQYARLTFSHGSVKKQAMNDRDRLITALSVSQELLRFYQVAGNVAEAAAAWFQLGNIYQQMDQFSDALSSYQQAIVHYQIVGDAMGESNALSHLGKVYEHQGLFSCALEHYEQALAKLRQNSDYLNDATTLSRLATCIEDMF